jgi:MFS family permease
MESTAVKAARVSEYSKRYRVNILFLLAASQAIAYLDRVNMSVAAPVLIRDYHWSPAAVGLVMSMFNWSYTFTMLVAGPFVDRVRARITYPLGVFIWSTATILCGTTVRFSHLAMFRGLLGVGEGPMLGSGISVIQETFPKEQRASAVAIFFSGNKVGLALGIPFAATVYHWWGLPAVFYTAGAISLMWLPWFMLTYRGKERPPAREKSTIRWITLLKYRTTWGAMLGQFGYLYVYFVYASWLPGYLVLQRKMSIMSSGFVAMLPFLVGMAVTISGGYISDWMVRRGVRVTIARKVLSCGGLCAATVFTLLGAYTASMWPAITYLTLAIAGFSLATGSIQTMMVDIAPPNYVASLFSLQNFLGNMGGACAPLVTGILLSTTKSFTVPLLVAAMVSLAAAGCYAFIVGSLDQELTGKPQANATA